MSAQTLRCHVVWRATHDNNNNDNNDDNNANDATTVTVPLELRWGVSARDVRAVWQLSEASFAVGYNADYYESLVTTQTWLSLLAYTTPAAYAAIERAAAADATAARATVDASDASRAATGATTSSTTPPPLASNDVDDALRRCSVEAAIAQLEQHARTRPRRSALTATAATAATASSAQRHDDETTAAAAVAMSSSTRLARVRRGLRRLRAVAHALVVAPAAAAWHVVTRASDHVVVVRSRSSSTRHDASSATSSSPAIAQHTSTLSTTTATTTTTGAAGDNNNNDDRDDDYCVVVGFVIGALAYAQCVLPSPSEEQQEDDDEKAQRSSRSRGSKEDGSARPRSLRAYVRALCVSPSGYIASFCVAPRLRGCGVGQTLLTHYLHYMTHDMPLTTDMFLHTCAAASQQQQQQQQRAEEAGAGDVVVQCGVREVWLHCLAGDASPSAFYTRRRFRVVRRLAAFYRFDDADHAALLLLYTRPDAPTTTTATADAMHLTPSLYASVVDVVHDSTTRCHALWQHQLQQQRQQQQQQQQAAVRRRDVTVTTAARLATLRRSDGADDDDKLSTTTTKTTATVTSASARATQPMTWRDVAYEAVLTANAFAVLGVLIWYCVHSDVFR